MASRGMRALVGALLVIGSCASGGDDIRDLWRVIHVTTVEGLIAAPTDPPRGVAAYIAFDLDNRPGVIGGDGTCASFSGTYAIPEGEESGLDISVEFTELSGCLDPGRQLFQDSLTALLDEVHGYAIEGDTLALLDETDATLILLQRSQPPNTDGTSVGRDS